MHHQEDLVYEEVIEKSAYKRFRNLFIAGKGMRTYKSQES